MKFLPHYYRLTAMLLLAAFVPQQVGFAEAVRVTAPAYGKPAKKVLYFIQDAHASIEAQKEIAGHILYLVRDQGVKTVFEEGYEGAVPTEQYFGQMTNAQARQKTADYFLDQLRLGGAEWAHVQSLSRREKGEGRGEKKNVRNKTLNDISNFSSLASPVFSLIGIDSKPLHAANIEAARQAGAARESIDKDLREIQIALKRAGEKILSNPAKEVLKLRERRLGGKIDLLDYVKRLRAVSPKAQLSTAAYPQMNLLLEMLHTANSGRNPTPDAFALMKELRQFEDEAVKEYLRTPQEKQLFAMIRNVEVLLKLNELQLSEEECFEAEWAVQELQTQETAEFLFRTTARPLVLSKAWEKKIAFALEFYKLAQERERWAGEKIREWVETSQENQAAVVFGGFHTAYFKKTAAALGIELRVITPKISAPDEMHEKLYRKLLNQGSAALPLKISTAARFFNLYSAPNGLEAAGNYYQEALGLAATSSTRSEMRKKSDYQESRLISVPPALLNYFGFTKQNLSEKLPAKSSAEWAGEFMRRIIVSQSEAYSLIKAFVEKVSGQDLFERMTPGEVFSRLNGHSEMKRIDPETVFTLILIAAFQSSLRRQFIQGVFAAAAAGQIPAGASVVNAAVFKAALRDQRWSVMEICESLLWQETAMALTGFDRSEAVESEDGFGHAYDDYRSEGDTLREYIEKYYWASDLSVSRIPRAFLRRWINELRTPDPETGQPSTPEWIQIQRLIEGVDARVRKKAEGIRAKGDLFLQYLIKDEGDLTPAEAKKRYEWLKDEVRSDPVLMPYLRRSAEYYTRAANIYYRYALQLQETGKFRQAVFDLGDDTAPLRSLFEKIHKTVKEKQANLQQIKAVKKKLQYEMERIHIFQTGLNLQGHEIQQRQAEDLEIISRRDEIEQAWDNLNNRNLENETLEIQALIRDLEGLHSFSTPFFEPLNPPQSKRSESRGGSKDEESGGMSRRNFLRVLAAVPALGGIQSKITNEMTADPAWLDAVEHHAYLAARDIASGGFRFVENGLIKYGFYKGDLLTKASKWLVEIGLKEQSSEIQALILKRYRAREEMIRNNHPDWLWWQKQIPEDPNQKKDFIANLYADEEFNQQFEKLAGDKGRLLKMFIRTVENETSIPAQEKILSRTWTEKSMKRTVEGYLQSRKTWADAEHERLIAVWLKLDRIEKKLFSLGERVPTREEAEYYRKNRPGFERDQKFYNNYRGIEAEYETFQEAVTWRSEARDGLEEATVKAFRAVTRDEVFKNTAAVAQISEKEKAVLLALIPKAIFESKNIRVSDVVWETEKDPQDRTQYLGRPILNADRSSRHLTLDLSRYLSQAGKTELVKEVLAKISISIQDRETLFIQGGGELARFDSISGVKYPYPKYASPKFVYWVKEILEPFARAMNFKKIEIVRVPATETDLQLMGFHHKGGTYERWFLSLDPSAGKPLTEGAADTRSETRFFRPDDGKRLILPGQNQEDFSTIKGGQAVEAEYVMNLLGLNKSQALKEIRIGGSERLAAVMAERIQKMAGKDQSSIQRVFRDFIQKAPEKHGLSVPGKVELADLAERDPARALNWVFIQAVLLASRRGFLKAGAALFASAGVTPTKSVSYFLLRDPDEVLLDQSKKIAGNLFSVVDIARSAGDGVMERALFDQLEKIPKSPAMIRLDNTLSHYHSIVTHSENISFVYARTWQQILLARNPETAQMDSPQLRTLTRFFREEENQARRIIERGDAEWRLFFNKEWEFWQRNRPQESKEYIFRTTHQKFIREKITSSPSFGASVRALSKDLSEQALEHYRYLQTLDFETLNREMNRIVEEGMTADDPGLKQEIRKNLEREETQLKNLLLKIAEIEERIFSPGEKVWGISRKDLDLVHRRKELLAAWDEIQERKEVFGMSGGLKLITEGESARSELRGKQNVGAETRAERGELQRERRVLFIPYAAVKPREGTIRKEVFALASRNRSELRIVLYGSGADLLDPDFKLQPNVKISSADFQTAFGRFKQSSGMNLLAGTGRAELLKEVPGKSVPRFLIAQPQDVFAIPGFALQSKRAGIAEDVDGLYQVNEDFLSSELSALRANLVIQMAA